uniref:Medium-chain acyl-CoA ligase ACSF2, mitochondrial n=1 Tax=Strongyloides papillosus TaxID=174720 RepID=A0A0N5CHQ8_STREA
MKFLSIRPGFKICRRFLGFVTPEERSYSHGSSDIKFLPHTIGDRLIIAKNKAPDHIFVNVMEENISKSYNDFYNDCVKFGSGLIKLGMKGGDRIAIWSPNTYEWLVTKYAAALNGMVLVNINPGYRINELSYAIKKVGVKVIVCPKQFLSSKYYEMLCRIIPEINELPEGVSGIKSKNYQSLEHLITFDDSNETLKGSWKFEDICKMGSSEEEETLLKNNGKVKIDDIFNIQYTSGTTGLPKAVSLTHHGMVNNAYIQTKVFKLTESKSSICSPAPLFHCIGSVCSVLVALITCNTVTIPSPVFNAERCLQSIDKFKIQYILGTPTMFIDILNHKNLKKYSLESLTGLLMGGAPCPEKLCKDLINNFKLNYIALAYGMTELSPLALVSNISEHPMERIKKTGYVYPHLECCITDSNGDILPHGETGELWFRGFSVMREYFGDEEKTRTELGLNRWLKTGDLAYMNKDGSVVISGRSKDMIIRGGENIYPVEIEQFLMKLPGVQDVQVVGVPNERLGEDVCAWICLKEGYERKITEKDVINFCKDKITHFKIPRYVLIKKKDDFPRTGSGKIQKFKIQEISIKELNLEHISKVF